MYEVVLVEGTLDDVRELFNAKELVRLYLPPWVRGVAGPHRRHRHGSLSSMLFTEIDDREAIRVITALGRTRTPA